jgi:hypothetical protein
MSSVLEEAVDMHKVAN